VFEVKHECRLWVSAGQEEENSYISGKSSTRRM